MENVLLARHNFWDKFPVAGVVLIIYLYEDERWLLRRERFEMIPVPLQSRYLY